MIWQKNRTLQLSFSPGRSTIVIWKAPNLHLQRRVRSRRSRCGWLDIWNRWRRSAGNWSIFGINSERSMPVWTSFWSSPSANKSSQESQRYLKNLSWSILPSFCRSNADYLKSEFKARRSDSSSILFPTSRVPSTEVGRAHSLRPWCAQYSQSVVLSSINSAQRIIRTISIHCQLKTS